MILPSGGFPVWGAAVRRGVMNSLSWAFRLVFFYFIGKSVLRGYCGYCIAKIDKNFVIQADYVKIFLFFLRRGQGEGLVSSEGSALFLFWKGPVLILEAPCSYSGSALGVDRSCR